MIVLSQTEKNGYYFGIECRKKKLVALNPRFIKSVAIYHSPAIKTVKQNQKKKLFLVDLCVGVILGLAWIILY